MTDDDPTSFNLNVVINRPDVVAWLQGLAPERVGPEVENAIAAGHFVLTLLTASAGEESMRRFFAPVADQMNQLRDTLQQFQRAAHKSQGIGKIGEDLVTVQLARAFPEDEFINKAVEAHQADIHASFAVDGQQRVTALVEVKLYTNDVPTSEIEKFRSDLRSTGQRFGLMVSLASRFSKMTGPISVEHTPDYVAVYVPSAGLDGSGLVWGAALLKSIAVWHARANRSHVAGVAIEEAWQRMAGEVEHLKRAVGRVGRLRLALRNARDTVIGQFDNMADEVFGAEQELQQLVGRLGDRLVGEFAALSHTGASPELPSATTPETIHSFLEQLRAAKDKRFGLYSALADLASALGCRVLIADDGHWTVSHGERRIARTYGSRTRLDVAVKMAEGPVTIDSQVESYDGKEREVLLSSGASLEAVVASLERRLRAALEA